MIDSVPTSAIDRDHVAAFAWLGSPSRRGIQVASALDEVRRAPSILAAMRRRANVLRVTDEAVRDGVDAQHLIVPLLDAITDRSDSVTGLVAVHALSHVPGDRVDADLAALVFDGEAGYEAHAAWAASRRPATPWLVEVSAGAVARGGQTGMHAQAALARWARIDPELVLRDIGRRLEREGSETARRYLTETAGLVPGRSARLLLERLALDPQEPMSVRETAVHAFTERIDERLPSAIVALAVEDGPLGQAVATIRARRALARRGPIRASDRRPGIRVAQLHLGAVLDAHVSQAGRGDTGGVATLLARLGSRLAKQPHVVEAVTIGRAPAAEVPRTEHSGSGHRFESVPLAPGEGGSFTSAWPSLVAAQRGIRAALLARQVPDLLHLRMADPGSLAGALVAEQLGISTIFTLAPDPHVHIRAREAAGELERSSFAAADSQEAYWLRVDVVSRLASQAREVVLFPRTDLRRDLQELVGIDIAHGAPRFTIVPEGVDADLADQAAVAVASGRRPAVLRDLRAAITALPSERHGLPLAVSVGRLHEVKGMGRLVAAFAADEALSQRANLVIVGGDLDDPSPAEAAELHRIEQVLMRSPHVRDRVILLGHRSNDEVAMLLAAARSGHGRTIGAGGAYVCASRKEEFGLAIVEALAAGLPVVAPISGGPASYVRPGVIGVLVDTDSPSAIAAGVNTALDLAGDPGTARAARHVVRQRFTIERMAQTLAGLYRMSAAAGSLALPVAEERAA